MKSLVILGAALGVYAGCGQRNPLWDRPIGAAQPFALTDAIAVADPQADRVVLLTTDADRHLRRTIVATQRGVSTVMVAPDRSKLFLVSAGDGDGRPPAGQEAQAAALEIVTRDDPHTKLYPLSQPLAGLALDPRGEWAVVYADQTSGALVRNPNELLLVDLRPAAGPDSLYPHTLRSFGGQPQRFTFTGELNLPGGARRLLVVETEQDVAVLDLLHPKDTEITIQLTSGQDTRQLHPAGIAVTDGAPAATDDARIAIRLANDPTIIMAQLVPGTGRDFRPDLNLTDVGGLASDAAFVRTDGGVLALAVLVPSRSKAVLIDPSTSVTVDVALPAPYGRLSLVTDQAAPTAAAAGATGVDVALLWNAGAGNSGGVSFWELGKTAGQPYRSVETVGVTTGVTSVLNVGGKHPELKILGTNAATFFLLDLKSRTSAPFLTSMAGVTIAPSLAGDRAWAFLPNTTELAAIDLETLHPEDMHIDRAIAKVFEIAAADADPKSGARSLVAWHELGNRGVTVYDGQGATTDASLDDRRDYSSVLTEGLDVHLP